MSIQERINLIFDRFIFKDIDTIKNYKYFENDKLLVVYIDASTLDDDNYSMLNIPEERDAENIIEEIYNNYPNEYDEDGYLISPEFESYDKYHYFYLYSWEDEQTDERIKNISNYVTTYLKFVGLEDLEISFYINCEK